MTALDAITTRAEFLDQVHDPFWLVWCENYAGSVTGVKPTGLVPDDFYPKGTTGEQMSRRLMRAAQAAHSYYVSPTMQVLVTAASHGWPEEELVREDDFPQPHGWLWIPGGITTLDVRGMPNVTNAVLWDVYGGGVSLHFLSDKLNPHDPLRQMNPEMWRRFSRFTPWAQIRLDFGQKIPQAFMLGKAVPPELAQEIKVTTHERGVQWFFPEGWSPEELQPHHETHPDSAWLLSCLRIMRQPLAALTEQRPDRATVRRLERKKIQMTNKLVTVIEYRRRASERSFEDSGRTLSHRYFRGGHWRGQHFKNEEYEWDYKVIWIHDQIVGDEHLPLKLREHVKALVR